MISHLSRRNSPRVAEKVIGFVAICRFSKKKKVTGGHLALAKSRGYKLAILSCPHMLASSFHKRERQRDRKSSMFLFFAICRHTVIRSVCLWDKSCWEHKEEEEKLKLREKKKTGGLGRNKKTTNKPQIVHSKHQNSKTRFSSSKIKCEKESQSH